jgi:hypothetical protein
MAVSVAFYSVVIRKSTIEARFPGGLKHYSAACPNDSLCIDDNIVRVGFMAFNDANIFIHWLQSIGFVVSGEVGISEVAIIRQDKGHLVPCNWLELGRIDGHPIAWLAGSEPGRTFIPAADMQLESMMGPISPEELKDRYELISRDESDVVTYRNKATGELVYVGRSSARVT